MVIGYYNTVQIATLSSESTTTKRCGLLVIATLHVNGNALIENTLLYGGGSSNNGDSRIITTGFNSLDDGRMWMAPRNNGTPDWASEFGYDWTTSAWYVENGFNVTSGNVGIGTTNPSEALEVNGNIAFTGPANLQNIDFLNGRAGDRLNFLDNAGNGSLIYESTSGANVARFSGQAPGNSLRITDNGNVGLGTSNPGAALEVAGSGDDIPIIVRTQGGIDGKPGMELVDPTANDYGARVYFDDAAGNSGGMKLYGLEAGTETGGLFVTRDGDVGIGDDTPNNSLRLDVEGQVGATEYCDQNGSNCIAQSDLGGQGKALYIRGAGNDNPTNRVLTIGDTTIYSGTLGRGLRLTVLSKSDFSVVSDTTYDTYGSTTASDNLATALNGITSAQIGILTSYDAWENQVTANLDSAFLRLGLSKAMATENTGSRRPYAAIFEGASNSENVAKAVEVSVEETANQPYAEIRGYVFDESFVAVGTKPNALFRPQGDDVAMIADYDGNVGIGDTSPSQKLEVGGNISMSAGRHLYFGSQDLYGDNAEVLYFDSNDADSARFQLRDSGDTNLGSLYGADSGEFGLLDRNSNWILTGNNGNVGIGTTNPQTSLDIRSDATQLSLRNDSTGRNATITMGSDISDPVVFETNNAWRFNTDGFQALDIRPDGNVGIGTTSTSARLDIVDTDGVALEVNGGEGGQDIARFNRANGTRISMNGAGGDAQMIFKEAFSNIYWSHGVDTSDGNAYKISQNGGIGTNDYLTIDTSGNVGIGTTSPGYQFDVYSTGSNSLRVQSDSQYNVAALDNLSGNAALQNILRFNNNGSTKWSVGNDAANGDALTFAANASLLSSGQRMVITTAGNVGIGDATPDGSLKLDVEGAVGASEFCDQNGNNCVAQADVGSGPKMSVDSGGADTENYWVKVADANLSGNYQDFSMILAFTTEEKGVPDSAIVSFAARQNNGSVDPNPKVRIMSMSGDATFGDDSFKIVNDGFDQPYEIWVQKKSAYTSLNVHEISSNIEGNISYNSNPAWQASEPVGSTINTRSAGLYYPGNFGLGVVNPSEKLDVAGNIAMSSGRHLYFGSQDLYGDNNQTLYFDSNNSSVARMQFRDSANTNLGSVYGDDTGNFGLLDADGQWAIQSDTDSNINFRVNNDEKMRVTSGGNVGVGTTNPGERLDIYGDTTGDVTARVNNNDGSGTSELWLRRNTDDWYVRNSSTGLQFDNDNNVAMTIQGAGNVGIGTTNPSYPLEVAGQAYIGNTLTVDGTITAPGTSADLYLDDDTWGGSYGINNYQIAGVNSAGVFIDTNNNTTGSAEFVIGANGSNPAATNYTDLFYVREDGDVGIGNTNPSEKLDVSGRVQATGYVQSSDESLKENISTVENAERIAALRGVSFDWKSDGRSDYGFIAQEVEEIFPELVTTSEHTGMKSVNYPNLIAIVLEFVKDQAEKIANLEQELQETNNRLDSLEERLEVLESAQ
jgi:hypothetical protein